MQETHLISKYQEGDLPNLIFSEFGRDGNIFAVAGTVRKALLRSDLPDKADLIKEVQHRVTSSHSYSDALAIAQEYVNLVDDTEDEEEDSEWSGEFEDEEEGE